MSSEKTQYYSLHRWRPEDAFLRAEFNENSELVDSALHGIRQEAATGVSGVQAAVEEARRAAEEAVEGARSEAMAAVSGAKNELTEALNKAKADLNAAVAAARKEAAAAVEAAKSEAEQAVQAARDAVPLVKLAELYATQDTDSLCLELVTLERSAFVVLKIYAELYTEKKEACLLCNDFFGLGEVVKNDFMKEYPTKFFGLNCEEIKNMKVLFDTAKINEIGRASCRERV